MMGKQKMGKTHNSKDYIVLWMRNRNPFGEIQVEVVCGRH